MNWPIYLTTQSRITFVLIVEVTTGYIQRPYLFQTIHIRSHWNLKKQPLEQDRPSRSIQQPRRIEDQFYFFDDYRDLIHLYLYIPKIEADIPIDPTFGYDPCTQTDP